MNADEMVSPFNHVGGFRLFLRGFCAILRVFCAKSGLLQQHHRLHHIWCVGSSFFNKIFSVSNMMLLQSFPQLLQAGEQCGALARDVN